MRRQCSAAGGEGLIGRVRIAFFQNKQPARMTVVSHARRAVIPAIAPANGGRPGAA